MAQVEERPSIAILGAGIGGLALAIGLIKRGVSVTIYEATETFSSVGAGIGLGPNALNAMDLLDARFREEYDKVKTGNEKPEFKNTVFDALYAERGFGEDRGWTRGAIGAPYFTRSSAHRKDLLRIMESFVPRGIVRFGKRARTILQNERNVQIEFYDGEIAMFDALVGCDGVKGITRQAVLGDIAPEQVAATYSGMYGYRGIVPMPRAKELLGRHAGDAKWFMTKGKGLVLYPITKGKEENFVFFIVDNQHSANWDLTIPCTRKEMTKDLEDFDPRLVELLNYARPLKWPILHHPETKTYCQGRICLLGDVAHASTPHQAAGAGQGLEDAAVLSHLLSLVKSPDQIPAAFQAYDAVRRPRAQRIVSTSYEAGLMYLWLDPELGDDLSRIVDNGNERLHWIWQHDLKPDIQDAEDMFLELISS